jgi:hypothetical protein
LIGAPDRIRTCGLRIRSPLLYPAELQAQQSILVTERPEKVQKKTGISFHFLINKFITFIPGAIMV